ncbi:Kievitone hydratase [Fusarium oxysporum]|uniref:Kievitone hydratase n=1 Tax=Fusarium oxysporum TaxID=5507 RepID=A0A420MLQ8_FUSOX|nr:Kievitone hydratase [Fusarium oxysporum]
MKFLAPMLGLAAVLTPFAQATRHTKSYSFQPENAKTVWKGDIPILFNLNETQAGSWGGSYWITSYVTTTENEQYFLVSHVLTTPSVSLFRASRLNLDNLEYAQFVEVGNLTSDRDSLDLKIGHHGFQALSDDNLSKTRAFSKHKDVNFDLTYEATTQALPNAGSGRFQFGPGTTWEWALPSCKTDGHLVKANGAKATIDPKKSFTWYDRQGGDNPQTPGNWTWFQLHVPSTSYKLSIWTIDDEKTGQFNRFATIRGDGEELQVLPVTFKPDYTRTFQSHASSKIVYPLDWDLVVAGFGSFRISSVKADQEMVGTSSLETAYEGFVTYTGRVGGKKFDGFGIVEIFSKQSYFE